MRRVPTARLGKYFAMYLPLHSLCSLVRDESALRVSTSQLFWRLGTSRQINFARVASFKARLLFFFSERMHRSSAVEMSPSAAA